MSSSRTFLLRILLIGLVLRLIPVLLARDLGIGLDDMFQYDMLARSLISGNGYRWYAESDLLQLAPYVDFDLNSLEYDPVRGVATSFRAPLYPLFLALVYAFSGINFSRFLAARLAQAILLGAPLAPLTYLLARCLLTKTGLFFTQREGEERMARVSAWIVAAYPMLLLFPLGLGTENLFFLLLLVSFLTLLNCIERRQSRDFLLAGFLLGLTALTRSVILPFTGLAVLWAWFSVKDRRGAALIALALVLTIMPWVVRNSLLHGRLTGIETSLGYNLYVGYHPESTGTFTFGPSLDLVPILDDTLRDRLGTEKALEFIRDKPERFFPLAINRLGHFFRLELRVLSYFYSSNFFGYIPTPILLAFGVFFGLPFALLSLSSVFGAISLPRTEASLLLVLLGAGYLFPHVFILSEERFHLALVPFLAILAASGWEVLRIYRLRSRALLTALLVCALLITNWTYQFASEADKYAIILGPEGNQSGFPY